MKRGLRSFASRYISSRQSYVDLQAVRDELAANYAELTARHDELTAERDELSARAAQLNTAYHDLKFHHDDLRFHHDDYKARLDEVTEAKRVLEDTYQTWVPPGHFYSPYADPAEVEKRSGAIFDTRSLPAGIDLRDDEQVALFEKLAPLAKDLPFPVTEGGEFRFFYDNSAYSWSDAIVLHAMLRHIRPSKVIEIGSGYSSAMTLDTIEGWLDPDTEFVCVEPYADLLREMVRPGDEKRVSILEKPVQDVPLETFADLGPGDVLFIDSTHVVKAGSDVNYLFFEVLPRLEDGVWVHIHDIFFPFEYPEEWVREGRAWQENYLLRAFLMFNDRFEVRWYQRYMWARHRQLLKHGIPDLAKNPGGNIWLQKVAR
ncbi:class I SAM-dependent methyltransferase [Amycolatopsis sp. CA-230715]|uniref:class I SAM-dependent methyltransferase n=1 Tax=Amycolatopsis sp. CA-230715 TaxID=2745196 RepID=UPI001C02ACC0|nr:class I SAM-dependent methyltransferase [Amycolatopsis sp. CA-230715]QWF80312.1 hypothetical protein HUW46_03732 [Amycolatopsis sp. CA-230715]